MTDFICPTCKIKIKTKPWGRNYIEVKCLCDEKDIRTDNTDDAIKQFLRKRKPPESDNEKHTINNKLSQLRSELLNNLSNHSDRSSKYPLYHMSSIENLQSMLFTGILSHDLSMEKKPKRISNSGIVDDRKKIILSSGYPLTHYANFYFQPKNAMLWKRLFVCQYCEKKIEYHDAEKLAECNAEIQKMYGSRIIPENIIIFEINSNFNQDGIFVSDGNCAVKDITTAKPMPAHDIFSSIDEMLCKTSWYNEDPDFKRRFQAECLIPDRVKVSSIHTIHVQNDVIQEKINNIIKEKFPNLQNIEVKINPSMFFS